ncbi:MAG TPA: M23 family metallopeptidase [Clostridiaceae bacterium]
MGLINKKIKHLREKKYTLMIIPNKKGITRRLVFSGIFFPVFTIISVTMIITLSTLCFFLFKGFNTEKLLLHSTENTQAMQKNLDSNKKQITKYKSDSAAVTSKLSELLTLEDKINSIINNKSSNLDLSRGGSTVISGQANFDDSIGKLTTLLGDMDTYVAAQRRIPSVFPVEGIITSTFGSRINPISNSYEYHPGIDFAGSYGTPIKATADGVVTRADWYGGYGNAIIINHGNGYETVYGHNSKLLAKVGATVKIGDIISLMGSTGASTGNHCHFEIRLSGVAIDPNSVVNRSIPTVK